GPENMTPVFETKNVLVCGDVRFTDKSNTHIFKLKDEDSKKIFEAVFFNSLEHKETNGANLNGNGNLNQRNEIKSGNYFDICYSIDKNMWKGREYTKLRIRDIKPSNY
ncbi:MAG: hypothetical protein LH629_06630, partial [Ignavibacteria bacterium]|nr:hypothetical protein [Ignavibacteria bacterium]